MLLMWMRKNLSLWRPTNMLAFALAVLLTVPPSFAEDKTSNSPESDKPDVKAVVASTQIDVPNPNGPGTVEITVTALETTNEAELLKAVANESGQSIVILQNTAAEGETPVLEAIQITPTETKQPFFKRIFHKTKSWFSKNSDRVSGFMISASSSTTGALGAYYLAGSSLEHAAYIGGAMLTVATLQATFTNSWNWILSLGSRAPIWVGKQIAERYNKVVQVPDWLQSVGELTIAAATNVAVTSAILIATDSYHSLATAAIVGTLGAYDYTVDIALRKFMNRGRMTQKQAFLGMKGRVMVGPVLETLSLAGFAPAQIAMGVIGLSGLYAIFRGESAYQAISSSHGHVVRLAGGINKAGTRIFMLPSDLKMTLSPVHPQRRPAKKNYCEDLLKRSHIRAFDDIN